jgi:purine-binding chemotaxis protein CheW
MTSSESMTSSELHGSLAKRNENTHDIRKAELGALQQYISFRVGEEEYGVDIMSVREIKAWSDTTMVPNTPEHMRGVLNLRGTIVPIFDMKCRFGMGQTETTAKNVIIIVQVDERVIGLLVDAVSDILNVYESEIRPLPKMDRAVDEEYLAGLITVEQRMVALLDTQRLFSARDVEEGYGAASVADFREG